MAEAGGGKDRVGSGLESPQREWRGNEDREGRPEMRETAGRSVFFSGGFQSLGHRLSVG